LNRRLLLALVGAVAVFTATALSPSTDRLPLIASASADHCPPQFVHANLSVGARCLGEGQFCTLSLDGEYHAYGFHCHPDPAGGQARLTRSAPTSADVSITKTAAPNPVAVGGTLTYTLIVQNNGPATAIGVVVTDVLPSTVTLLSASASSGTCSGTTTITCVGLTASPTTIVISVRANAPGSLSNTASVSSSTTDPVPGNNSATAIVTVDAGAALADLSLTKTDSPDPATVGSNLTYTITVRNNGPATAAGVRLGDTLPSSVTLVSSNASQGNCGAGTGVVSVLCELGSLASGGSATVTIIVRPTAAGNITNIAAVVATTPDPNEANNSASASTTVNVAPSDRFRLLVSFAGTGAGAVTSSPAGIQCGAVCATEFTRGAVVTLTATPLAGSVFAGWSGPCTGTGPCTVTVDAAKTVTATFNPASFGLTVSRQGSGSGAVSSNPPAISCGFACAAFFPNGTTVTLTATAAAGSRFVGWGGACVGSGACNVRVDANKVVVATFELLPRNEPPSVRAIASSGKRGTTVRLRFRVYDDGGQTRERIEVYRFGRVLQRISTSLHSVQSGALYYVNWKPPKSLRGALTFCVTAWDDAGQQSNRSCGALRIR